MEIGSENSLSVRPTPRSPLLKMPPDKIARYDRQPMAIAPLMSESGAGRATVWPAVVMACAPESSKMVLTKMYAPAPNT